jgi:hypothetical protein
MARSEPLQEYRRKPESVLTGRAVEEVARG